jgi:hypothetical protein
MEVIKIKKILDWLKAVVGDKIVILLVDKLLTKDNIIKAVDSVLDALEDLTAKTGTKVDDAAVKAIRDALNIPDND